MSYTVKAEVPNVGTIEMKGRGPWSVYENGPHSFDIRDADDRTVNPDMIQKHRRISNVVFSKRDMAKLVVEACNKAFDELPSGDGVVGD